MNAKNLRCFCKGDARDEKKGFTPEQTKLKAVWENPHIASVCSEMPNMAILHANVAASLDQTELSLRDKQLMDRYG